MLVMVYELFVGLVLSMKVLKVAELFLANKQLQEKVLRNKKPINLKGRFTPSTTYFNIKTTKVGCAKKHFHWYTAVWF